MLVQAHLESWVQVCSHAVRSLTNSTEKKDDLFSVELLFLSGKLSLPLFLLHVFWWSGCPSPGCWVFFLACMICSGMDVWTDQSQQNTVRHFLAVLGESIHFWIRLNLAKYNSGAAGHHIAIHWAWELSHVDGNRDENWREPRFWWHHFGPLDWDVPEVWPELFLSVNAYTCLLA